MTGLLMALSFSGQKQDHSMMMKNQGKMSEGKAMAMIQLPSVQCGMCENTIETGLKRVDGIFTVDVNIENKMGHVMYDPEKIDEAGIEKAIAGLGYWANDKAADPGSYENLPGCCQMSDEDYNKLTQSEPMDMKAVSEGDSRMAMINLPTIQCGSCKKRIERNMKKVDGILKVNVDVEGNMGHITYDPAMISVSEIERAIADIGYQANDVPANKSAYDKLPGCCKVP